MKKHYYSPEINEYLMNETSVLAVSESYDGFNLFEDTFNRDWFN